jgi:hypothetical protein
MAKQLRMSVGLICAINFCLAKAHLVPAKGLFYLFKPLQENKLIGITSGLFLSK